MRSKKSLLTRLLRLPYNLSRLPFRTYHSARWRLTLFFLRGYESYPRGSVRFLQSLEHHFGGYVSNISSHYPSYDSLCTGGDRMCRHNYGLVYSRHLSRFLDKSDLVILECGILKGSGLAMWSVLFPRADIIGMDIDPINFTDNLSFLRSQGAFSTTSPKIIEFDQLSPDSTELLDYLSGRKIDIFIDDGLHSDASIMNTLDIVYPLLNKDSVCFIEDNNKIGLDIKRNYSASSVSLYGELTVIENN